MELKPFVLYYLHDKGKGLHRSCIIRSLNKAEIKTAVKSETPSLYGIPLPEYSNLNKILTLEEWESLKKTFNPADTIIEWDNLDHEILTQLDKMTPYKKENPDSSIPISFLYYDFFGETLLSITLNGYHNRLIFGYFDKSVEESAIIFKIRNKGKVIMTPIPQGFIPHSEHGPAVYSNNCKEYFNKGISEPLGFQKTLVKREMNEKFSAKQPPSFLRKLIS